MLRPLSSRLPHELWLFASLQPHRAASISLISSRATSSRILPSARAFHATPTRQIPLPALFVFLKSSSALATIATASKAFISFLPLPLAFHWGAEAKLSRYEPKRRKLPAVKGFASDEAWRIHDSGLEAPKDAPYELLRDLEKIRDWEAEREPTERWRNVTGLAVAVCLWLPIIVFALAVAAGLERAPITGRWRLILLSPAEEETLHDALAGTGWFDHVLRLLQLDVKTASPSILPAQDWRWAWVESTLRALERGAEECYRLSQDPDVDDKTRTFDSSSPTPPSPAYPLKPRPRMAHMLHHAMPYSASDSPPPSHPPDQLLGPPFSLLLLKNDESNAFSYGFGDEGAAGIVVNTGILDEILRSTSSSAQPPDAPAPNRSWLSSLFFARSTSPPPFVPPTADQTLHLATVLAHEVSHLLLTHHLESLSQRQILMPSVWNFGVDLLRSILYPFTLVLGPIANDGIANMSKTGAVEMAQLGSNCASQTLEIEADLVGLRILAASGFNPYDAARFWQSDHVPTPSLETPATSSVVNAWRTLKSRTGLSHPTNQVRSEAVLRELDLWRKCVK